MPAILIPASLEKNPFECRIILHPVFFTNWRFQSIWEDIGGIWVIFSGFLYKFLLDTGSGGKEAGIFWHKKRPWCRGAPGPGMENLMGF
jgi:hypothetical protein